MKWSAFLAISVAAMAVATFGVEAQTRKPLHDDEEHCVPLTEAVGHVFGTVLAASGFLPTIQSLTEGTLLKITDSRIAPFIDFFLTAAGDPATPEESSFDGYVLHHLLLETISVEDIVYGAQFTTALSGRERNFFCERHQQSFWADTLEVETVLGVPTFRTAGSSAKVLDDGVMTCEGINVITVDNFLFSCADTHVDPPEIPRNCPEWEDVLRDHPIMEALLDFVDTTLPEGGTLFLPTEEALAVLVEATFGKTASELERSDFTDELITAIQWLLSLHYSPAYVPEAAIPDDVLGAALPTLAEAEELQRYCVRHPVSDVVEISPLGDDFVVLSSFNGGLDAGVVEFDKYLTCGGAVVHLIDHLLFPCLGFTLPI